MLVLVFTHVCLFLYWSFNIFRLIALSLKVLISLGELEDLRTCSFIIFSIYFFHILSLLTLNGEDLNKIQTSVLIIKYLTMYHV